MAILPPIKKLQAEDFPDQKGWIAKMLRPLNQFMETVYVAMNRGLTASENLDAQVATVQVIEGRVSATAPVVVPVTTTGRPRGVTVTSIEDLDGKTVTATPGVLWSYYPDQKQIKITQVFGITNGGRYMLTLYIHCN
jgi:hypothetical protein